MRSRQNVVVVKLRLVASLVLLLIAIGLPVAAISTNGPPWGFRGHQAVVLEVAGTVEAAASEARRQKEARVDDKLEVAPNLHLDAGDEVRVARLSQARLRFENAEVTIGDGARVVIGSGRIQLARGLLTVKTQTLGGPLGGDGARKPFEVALDSGTLVVVRAGAQEAVATILADGKGGARAFVVDGSLEARSTSGETLSEPGRLLVVEGDKSRVIDRPTALAITASCANGKLNIVAPPQVQVFGGGALTYPDTTPGAETGSAIVDVDPGTAEVALFARDVVGNVARVVGNCAPPPKKR